MVKENSSKEYEKMISKIYSEDSNLNLLSTAHSDTLKEHVSEKLSFFKKHLSNKVLVEIGSGTGMFVFPVGFPADFFHGSIGYENFEKAMGCLGNPKPEDVKKSKKELRECMNGEPFIKTLNVSKFVLLDPNGSFSEVLEVIEIFEGGEECELISEKNKKYYKKTCTEVFKNALTFLEKQDKESMIICSAGAFDLYDEKNAKHRDHLRKIAKEIYHVTPKKSITFHYLHLPIHKCLLIAGFKEMSNNNGFIVYYKE